MEKLKKTYHDLKGTAFIADNGEKAAERFDQEFEIAIRSLASRVSNTYGNMDVVLRFRQGLLLEGRVIWGLHYIQCEDMDVEETYILTHPLDPLDGGPLVTLTPTRAHKLTLMQHMLQYLILEPQTKETAHE